MINITNHFFEWRRGKNKHIPVTYIIQSLEYKDIKINILGSTTTGYNRKLARWTMWVGMHALGSDVKCLCQLIYIRTRTKKKGYAQTLKIILKLKLNWTTGKIRGQIWNNHTEDCSIKKEVKSCWERYFDLTPLFIFFFPPTSRRERYFPGGIGAWDNTFTFSELITSHTGRQTMV